MTIEATPIERPNTERARMSIRNAQILLHAAEDHSDDPLAPELTKAVYTAIMASLDHACAALDGEESK